MCRSVTLLVSLSFNDDCLRLLDFVLMILYTDMLIFWYTFKNDFALPSNMWAYWKLRDIEDRIDDYIMRSNGRFQMLEHQVYSRIISGRSVERVKKWYGEYLNYYIKFIKHVAMISPLNFARSCRYLFLDYVIDEFLIGNVWGYINGPLILT
jgi:hypothetical protein